MDITVLEQESSIRELFFGSPKTRRDILDIEEAVKSMSTSFDECPYEIKHSFADGMYTRELHIPAGHLICGKIHKNEYFVNMPKGKAIVVSEFGAKELEGPCNFKAQAGVKHIGLHTEDTIWIDTHKVNSTTIEEAEKEIFADSYQEYDEYKGIYDNMCDDIGVSKEQIREKSETDDLAPQPECDEVEILPSSIEGLGVFATDNINEGAIFALARIHHLRTPVGRYTNHSDDPNAIGVNDGYLGMLCAKKGIKKGEEITVNYRDIVKQSEYMDKVQSCLDG